MPPRKYLAFIADFPADRHQAPLTEAVQFCATLGLPMAAAAAGYSWHGNDIYQLFAEQAPGRAEISFSASDDILDQANDILERRLSKPGPAWNLVTAAGQADQELRRLLTTERYKIELRIGPDLFRRYPHIRKLQNVTPDQAEYLVSSQDNGPPDLIALTRIPKE